MSEQNETQKQLDVPAQDSKQKEYVYDRQQKAFFLTLNNPETYGYDHDKIMDVVHAKFKNIIYWCMCDEQGTTYHTHLYIMLSKKKRWSSVQNAFPHAHIEATVKGSPEQCRAYIRKEGKFSQEKIETNFPDTFYEEGKIPDFFITADKTEMLLQIESMLDSGMTPSEIMDKSIVFRQYEPLIRKHFFAKRYAETPPERKVKCYWHLGASGSGKSYTYVKLCEQYGADNIFYASDYSSPRCASLFDGYEAEAYVLLDEMKLGCMPYDVMLQILQGYKSQLHCRYSNAYALYKEIHITSIYTPQEIYNGMVEMQNRQTDSLYQLLRRITAIVYHYKDDKGNFCTYELPTSEYTTYEDLKNLAESTQNDGFIPLDVPSPFEEQEPEQEKLPFED